MTKTRFGSLFVLAVLGAVACSTDDGVGPAASAGSGGSTSGSGGVSAGAGSPTSGGAGSGLGGTAAGSSSAGTSTAGAATTGGAGAGGMGAGGTSAGSGGGGGSSNLPVKPSAGCSRNSTDVTIPNSLIGKPPGYSGTDPVPAVIAFHAAGNDNTSIQGAFKSSDLAMKYFMVYPNSASATGAKNGWNMQADRSRYLEVQAALLSQACVDENRIYATGHSSGAQFIVQLLCSGDADFDGVAPIASSVYCQGWENGAVPALIIHGVQDQERTMYGLNDGDGKKDLQPYLASNMCESSSTPFDPDLSRCGNVQGIDGKPFSAGCVEYSGCSAKTQWCNHNDPQYGTSNHGIPCFGVRAIYDFFESL